MSEFSVYLKKLVDASGETITSIAAGCNLERTSLHKAISGKRTLPYRAARELADYLKLPLDEREKFLALYDLSLQGRETFESRRAICDLLNSLSAINFHMPPLPETAVTSVPTSLVRGEYAVCSTIRTVLFSELEQSDHTEIFAYLPGRLNLTEDLLRYWVNGRKFVFTELLSLGSEEQDSATNLSLLRKVIPLSLVSKGNYFPYYYYRTPESASLSPMNYYIILPHCLIQIAGDLSVAQVRRDEEVRNVYRTFFSHLLQSCELMVHCITDIRDVLKFYIGHASLKELQDIMVQPCLGRYYTAEIIQRHIRSNDMPYEQLFYLANTRFSDIRGIKENFWTVFTEKGLQQIVDTGAISELPPEYAMPFSQEEIPSLLQSLRDEIAQDTVNGLLVRPSMLSIPDYIVFDIDSENGIHISTTNAFVFGAYCCDLTINTPAIRGAFVNFIRTLPGSPMVYSKEETLQILDRYIGEAQARVHQ